MRDSSTQPDEDEECQICRSDELPASISLLPCKHKVCISCVEAMRASNVFKGKVHEIQCSEMHDDSATFITQSIEA